MIIGRRWLIVLTVILLSTAPADAQSTVATGVSDEATEANSEPKIARDARGTVHLAFVKPAGGFDQIFVASSADSGRTWRIPQITTRAVPSRYPTLAAGPGDVLHLAWTSYEPVGHVYYARSANGGWTAPVKISPGTDYAGVPSIAADPQGDVHVVWYGIRPQAPQVRTRHGSIYEILYTGTSRGRWSAPVVISPGIPDSINPTLAADAEGRLHSAWYQFAFRGYQVKYARRTQTWASPQQITSGRTDAFAVAMAVGRDGSVYIVWEDRVSQVFRVYLAERHTGWSGPQAISPEGRSGSNPTVAVDDKDRIYVAWESDGQLYLRRRDRQWLGTERIAAEGQNSRPVIAAQGSTVDLMWTQQVGNDRRLRFVTLAVGAAVPRAGRPGLAAVIFLVLILLLLWQFQRRRRLTSGS